jgi:ubiquinol-cytochrome c reductase cytochrome b subunit
MSSTTKPSWVATRLPFLAQWQAAATTPRLPREPSYYAGYAWLIVAALIFLSTSGLVLAVHYDAGAAYRSLQFIDRNVANGWLVHGFHETGTTMLFLLFYYLMFRGLLARRYKQGLDFVWLLEIAAFALLLLVGWLGYTLSGGAVAFWSLRGATDAAVTLTGPAGAFATWFFGGPDGAGTLGRMEVLHVALALLALALFALNRTARRAVTRPVAGPAAVGFHPYYTAQYFVALVVFALIFSVLLFFAPHLGANPLNAAAASPLIVPAALTPPWYLAPLTAIAGVFPGMYGAMIGVLAALLCLAAMPWLDRAAPGARPGGLYRVLVYVLALDVLGLGLALAAAPSTLASILVVVFTVWYFLHFLVLTPVVTSMEAE